MLPRLTIEAHAGGKTVADNINGGHDNAVGGGDNLVVANVDDVTHWSSSYAVARSEREIKMGQNRRRTAIDL
ncbi:MAG: hypothetical protein WDZ51_10445 [Pirellulaceae bacterium]